MPLVVATHDVQLSSEGDAGGRTIPSPPPSPKSPPTPNPHPKSNALFDAAIIGNLRGFLDALSDPTVDVNILDGPKSRRNVLFCALVGTRSVRSVFHSQLLPAVCVCYPARQIQFRDRER